MDHARPGADLVQHAVGARRAAQLGDRARLVLEVAEGDRLRRARLLAGGEDVAVPHAALLVTMRVVLAGDDPLYAHRALLHDAELAHGDIGVELHVERRREIVVVPVEPTHVVRTVVAAVPRADTPVVHLGVQPLLGAIRREHRTDRLARRDLAVQAEHRHEGARCVGRRTVLEPALDAEPVHLPPVRGLGLADHRDVVLGDAGNHAGSAADAGVDVDGHAPAVAGIALVAVHRDLLVRLWRAVQRLLTRRGQLDVTRTTSPRAMPSARAASVAISTHASHATEVSGSGASCSHARDAPRPSYMRNEG